MALHVQLQIKLPNYNAQWPVFDLLRANLMIHLTCHGSLLTLEMIL